MVREEKVRQSLEAKMRCASERRQKQTEAHKRNQERDLASTDQFARNIQDKQSRTQHEIEVPPAFLNLQQVHRKKDYWKELRKLDKDMQMENLARLTRAEEHKRLEVWESHKSLHDKNNRKSYSSMKQQCFVRAQAISTRKGKEATYEFINQLMKADPHKQEQRGKLVDALRTLNQKFEFGLKLRLPSPNIGNGYRHPH
jgi:hypothetical protein